MQPAIGRRIGAAAVVIVLITGAMTVLGGGPAAAAKPLARAVLLNGDGQAVGTVYFEGKGHHTEWVRVELALPLPAGSEGLNAFHGFHIHTTGLCTAPAFTSANGHWNLTGESHGKHTGDLPSVLVGPDGTASGRFETHRFDVNQLFDVDGSAVVLHNGVDNFGNVPIGPTRYADPNFWNDAPGGTAATGDAGTRYACGVVQPA